MKRNYIAGEWLASDDAIENRNPSDISDLIGTYAQATTDQLESALDSARAAQKLWQASGLEARQTALMKIGTAMMDRADELGELLSREEGKPRAEGRGEIYRAGQFFTYYAAEVLRQIGDNADSVRAGIEIDVRRDPVGIIAVVSPWNFPTATAVWKIAPALAFGNAVIWKPANLVPASAVALTEIIADAGLPDGLFNLVMGSGATIGDALVSHPAVNAITFTGSVETGRRIAAAAIGNMPRMQMEMGSKNALVVMDDADIDLAVACAVNGAFGGTGQKCTASSRLIVHDAIHDTFVEELVAETTRLQVGHALEDNTQIGPVVSAAQLAENLDYVALAKQEGGEILCGGERLELAHDGNYMAPCVVAGTGNDWRINREEMFAPIACVIRAGSYEEALALSNDTSFGLTAGIMTTSLARAADFRRRAETGVVMVNLPTAGTDYHVPFGGRGESSYGPREQGQYAVEFFTSTKTAYIAAGTPS
ncbi:MAG: aldehyde dehydrogenase family protein [Pseudomonadota bacterium]|nr:aldehyde dehydrogenase family protein [Pseudomonadota bacterium]MEC8130286.1 aldehyde dehydrogenase family protein [Pseudomonadota bacterium]